MGGDMIPRLVTEGAAHVYDYTTNIVPGDEEGQRGYWRDVGTLDAFFDAHMDLVQPLPAFSLYNQQWPIFTMARSLPPAKLVRDGVRSPDVYNTTISNGAILSGCTVYESVIAPNVRVERDATLEGTVLFDDVRVGAGAGGEEPGQGAGPTRIGFDREEDAARFTVSDGGIVAVPKRYKF